MNNRAIGDEFEKYLAEVLGLKRTPNSGAIWDNGDLANRFVIVEAKVKSKPGIPIDKTEVKKVQEQAKKLGRDWVYIVKNEEDKSFVLTSLDFFIESTEEYFKKWKQK